MERRPVVTRKINPRKEDMSEPVLKLVGRDDAEAIVEQSHEDLQMKAAARAAELSQRQNDAVTACAAATQAAEEYRANLNLVDDDSAMRLRLRMEVLRDRADEAEAQARVFSDQIAPILREASLDRQRAELDQIRQQLSQRPCASQQNRLRTFMRAFRADAQVAIRELASAVETSNVLRARARQLSVSLSAPENFGAWTVAEAIGEVLAQLEAEAGDGDVTAVSITNATGDPRKEQFRVELIGRTGGAS
jgi:hypothetical protein